MVARSISRAEIDCLIDGHFRAELAVDVPAILTTLTPDVHHDIIGRGEVHGRAAVGERYTRIFHELAVDRFVPVRRLYGDDFVVDEVIVEGQATGRFVGLSGGERPVRFRLPHVFELRDGLIARETACYDLAAVQQQFG
jgi:predicted ester cyclase